MKRRTEIILLAAVLVGVAAVSSVKRAARSSACSGGSCCVPLPGLSVLGTNHWAGTVATNEGIKPTAQGVATNGEH